MGREARRDPRLAPRLRRGRDGQLRHDRPRRGAQRRAPAGLRPRGALALLRDGTPGPAGLHRERLRLLPLAAAARPDLHDRRAPRGGRQGGLSERRRVRRAAPARDDADRPGPDQRRRQAPRPDVAPPPPLRPAVARRVVDHAGLPVPLRGEGAGRRAAGRHRRPDQRAPGARGQGRRREARRPRARRLPALPPAQLPAPARGRRPGSGRFGRRRPGGDVAMSRGGSGRRPPDDEGRDERRRFERPHGAEGTGPPEARFSGYHDATDHHREVTAAEIEAHEQALPESGERDFEPDVERIHRPIYREPRDPIEGREPVPWWLWAATAISLFWGGWYLGRYGGSFGTATHVDFAYLKEFVVEEAVEQGAQAALDPEVAGQRIYTARCQVCHQANGLGVPGTFPPLIGADWVVGPPEYIVLILLHGLQG